MTKKTTAPKAHAADTANLALIPEATKFTAAILKANKQNVVELPTLLAARTEAARMNATANNGRKALVYAIHPKAGSILVPASYALPGTLSAAIRADIAVEKAGLAAAEKAAKVRAELAADRAPAKPAKTAKVDKRVKVAKAEKPAKPAKAAKAAPKKRDGSKTDIVVKMLTRKGGTTRKEIVEATEWNVDLKQLCARKGMKLKKSAEGVLTATPPKE